MVKCIKYYFKNAVDEQIRWLTTKIYRELNNVDDTLALQSDLDSLENWTKSWQVKFNSEKCEVMRISHKQDKSKHPYYLSNTELRFVDSYKDLGINMSRDLSWSNHVDVIVNKANKMLGLLKHRQPKRTMCGFGLQRSFGRIWSEYTRIIRVLSDAK